MKYIKRAVDRLLNSFDYYKVEMPEGEALTESDIMELFGSYGENTTFKRFMRDLCYSDIALYFQATCDRDRDMIRGAEKRTKYFLALIKKTTDTG
ncbi:hypothetical protein KAU11_12205, partial [Candidatus Babeliales bacterium]|nr:hypothetical protein [Candidatus Babeliales bacterium]